jgi:hypothetical protein
LWYPNAHTHIALHNPSLHSVWLVGWLVCVFVCLFVSLIICCDNCCFGFWFVLLLLLFGGSAGM